MYKRKFSMHIISFVFKALCTVLILAVLGILLWRFFSSGNPSSMKKIVPNPSLCSAYSQNPKMKYFTQKQNTITRTDHNSGYFSVTEAKFFEDADQVQLIFRYNNSTLKHLKEDYSLESVPDRNDEIYDVTLTIAYDLTPEDTSDNAGNAPESVRFERIHATYSSAEQKNLYNYRKFVFDGVKTGGDVLAVYVDIYYNQDIDYDKKAYGTLIIYDYKTKNRYSSLSGSDKKALDAWIESNKE